MNRELKNKKKYAELRVDNKTKTTTTTKKKKEKNTVHNYNNETSTLALL